MRHGLALALTAILLVVVVDYKNSMDVAAYICTRCFDLEARRLNSTDYIDVRRRYAVERTNGLHPEVIFLGDSLTYGLNLDRIGITNGQNRAIEGDTTLGLLNRLEEAVGTQKLGRVYLMIGYNDLKFRNNEQILDNLDVVVRRLKADRIIIQSVLPIDRKRRWFNHRIVELNDMIQDRFEGERRIILLDVYQHFNLSMGIGIRPALTRDGVHLNGDGYSLWERLLAETDRNLPK